MDICVPSLGESVTEVRIVRWLKGVGEFLQQDEPVVELETGKITMEISSLHSGILKEIFAFPGSSQKIGALLGRLEEVSSKIKKDALKSKCDRTFKNKQNSTQEHSSQKISPARFPFLEHEDEFLENQRLEKRVPLTPLRRRISERLKKAQETAVMLTTVNEVDMSRVLEMKALYQEDFQRKHGVKLGLTSFVVQSVVHALKEVPVLNAEMREQEVIYKYYYHIGIAVRIDGGIIVPILKDADRLSFSEIEKKLIFLLKKPKMINFFPMI